MTTLGLTTVPVMADIMFHIKTLMCSANRLMRSCRIYGQLVTVISDRWGQISLDMTASLRNCIKEGVPNITGDIYKLVAGASNYIQYISVFKSTV